MARAQREHEKTYAIDFTEEYWDDIVRLGFEPFEPEPFEELTRGQWMAIAAMALGDAQMLDEGYMQSPAENSRRWATDLRTIARKIMDKFKPGDGQV